MTEGLTVQGGWLPAARRMNMADLNELLEELASPERERSARAHSLLLRRLDLPAVVAGVVRHLAHPEPEVRRIAAQIVAELGPVAGSAFPHLLLLLDDPEPRVRREACLALCALGEGASPRDLTEAMMKAAHDPVYEVRKAAVDGLHRIGPRIRVVPRGTGGLAADDEPDGPIPEWVNGLADSLRAHITPRHGGYVLTLPVGDNRLQRVRLSTNPSRDTLTISTECGPLHPSRYGWALEENLHLYPGCLALRHETKQGRHDELVLLITVPLAEAYPDAMAELVLRLAHRGDQYEQLLTGEDHE